MLLIALLAPPAAGPSALQARCLDAGHAPSCDRWLAPPRRAPPEAHLRRACAFEAPRSCGLLADRRPAWASVDQRIGWRQIACRADAGACVRLAQEMGQASEAVQRSARRAAERGCRRWSEVCYALATQARDPVEKRRLLERACAGDDGRACRQLAWRLATGDGVAADPERARVIGDRACLKGADDLCLRRLRARQEAGDHAGVRRRCRQGDALSCAAHDARLCLRGDAKACDRARVTPPGACRPVRGECDDTPSLPPHGSRKCATTDSCAPARRRQRVQAQQLLTEAARRCGLTRGRAQIQVSRSGDVFAMKTDAGACFEGAIAALRLPPSAAPSTLTARAVRDRDRVRVAVQVRSTAGPPIPRRPLAR